MEWGSVAERLVCWAPVPGFKLQSRRVSVCHLALFAGPPGSSHVASRANLSTCQIWCSCLLSLHRYSFPSNFNMAAVGHLRFCVGLPWGHPYGPMSRPIILSNSVPIAFTLTEQFDLDAKLPEKQFLLTVTCAASVSCMIMYLWHRILCTSIEARKITCTKITRQDWFTCLWLCRFLRPLSLALTSCTGWNAVASARFITSTPPKPIGQFQT